MGTVKYKSETFYEFDGQNKTVEELALILEDNDFNMRKKNSKDYKESVGKKLWISTTKQ